jgi:gliding motility-associated-like protein
LKFKIPSILNCIRHILTFLFLITVFSRANAQCPPNIDFENGNFDGWTLYTGNVTVANGITLTAGFGDDTRQQIMSSLNPGPDSLDYFGHFPVYCPNGSRHSLKLGNTDGGAQAEGISYEFTIPVNAHHFNITYYYAVVFQDPGHDANQQPRLNIDVQNLTDNTTLGCSSFSFIATSGLPGFFKSDKVKRGDITLTPVWCKNWSANSINLDGYEGKTIRLFFKTSDCTFSVHFGYAYIDVETQCNSSFPGASFCLQDTAIDVKGPYGYENYTWYSSDFSQILGTGQTLHLNPIPPAGTNIKVEVTPFSGYGCIDTLSSNLTADLDVTANAGADIQLCDTIPVRIGSPPVPGVIYKWLPTAGLSNANISNPFANPDYTTEYILTVSSPGGGCTNTDNIKVSKLLPPNTMTLTGNASYCEGSGILSILHVNAADSIQWYKDDAAIPAAHNTDYTVTETGTYYATLFSFSGCYISTASKTITVYPLPVAAFSAANLSICTPSDSAILTNTSSITSGSMNYHWTFGDGTSSNEISPAHIYTHPGNYEIKLLASAAGGCSAEISQFILVKPGAAPAFTAENICVDLTVPLINRTNAPDATVVNYLWDFGNGNNSNLRNPVYAYTSAGSYTIKLTTSTPECPDVKTFQRIVTVMAPAIAERYPDHPAIINFAEPLQARSIGVSALWTPAVNLSNRNGYNPYFKGATEQLYTIKLTTKEHCVTVDTLLVKPYKKIGINVPGAFTPNGDGTNDFLKPILWGIKKVNYFRVFNRYGELLFEMKSDEPGWNGKVKGSLQNMQAVVWIIEAEDVDGGLHQEKGTSILMR